MEHRLRISDRDVDPRIAIARAGFEEQDRMARVGGKTIGEDAARRIRLHHRGGRLGGLGHGA
jgi:hypothetical protein